MKLTFLGAAHEVTGSATLIEVGGKNILVDFGMEQGKATFENQEPLVSPAEIDCVLLTHAHIDHSGNLPLLYKNGFRGVVYATDATSQLCEIMLMDSAHIQKMEADWKNRKAKRRDEELYTPIYDFADVEGILSKFRPCSYDETMQVLENVEIRFVDVGHLLGAASIEIWLREDGEARKLVFSGDVGNIHKPIIKDPQTIKEADYVVIESTYGNRFHEGPRQNYVEEFSGYIQKTLDRGGNVVIPSFAVGRAQELLYFIREVKERNLVTGHGDFKVYLDSPLAQEATGIFLQCDPNQFDTETRELLDRGINPLFFKGLEIALTSQDSAAINFDPEPKVIISASGMCEAGRIRHHLKHNLWREECLILFTGYQAEGTFGRLLLEQKKSTVKLFGEEIAIKAEISALHNTSGHADQTGLTNWLDAFDPRPKHIFVNHGNEESCDAFTAYLNNERGYSARAPYSGTIYDLITGNVLVQTEGIRVKSPTPYNGKDPRAVKVFGRLMDAVNRLSALAQGSEGMSNKDLAKLADQIDRLSEKWSK